MEDVLISIGNFFVEKPEIIVIGAAVVTLIFTAKSWNKDRETRELQMAEGIFKDLRELEREYYDKFQKMTEEEKSQWDSLFFNTLEWFAFLINENKLKDKKIVDFFKPAIIEWFEDIFNVVYDASVKDDETQFEELKKLYKKLNEEA